ncbi:MAG: hypothetical protein AAFQ83_10195 [Bacteroidota bacterium]
MKQRLLLLLTALCFGSTATFAQIDDFNISLQFGYNFSNLNPGVMNFTIDSTYIPNNPDDNPQMGNIRWTDGFSAGIGYHRRRASFRLHGHLLSGTTFATGENAQGELIRTTVGFSGSSIGLDLTTELIDFDFFAVGVGTGLTMNNFQTQLSRVPVASFSETDALPVISDDWKFGFKLHLPLRFKAPSYVALSLEPYFLVFFSPVDFEPFNEALNGAGATQGRLFDEMDHFGVNGSIIIYLFNRK